MRGRVGMFLWRHQRVIAAGYVGLLALGWAGFLGFTYLAPASAEVGAAVAARAVAYHRTFREVHAARDELETGDVDVARRRLEKFLAANAGFQRSQLETHAVVEAHELLSGIYLEQGRTGRAVRLLRTLTERLPLHYRAWFLRGQAESAGGRGDDALASLGAAFRLTLNHPEVTEEYLGMLADRTAFERIAWVDDQFRRASVRALPIATVKVGVPRAGIQRAGIAWAGIPIEHGSFFRSFERRGLPRGKTQTLACPEELFWNWPNSGKRITLQVRFEHVYEGLVLDALRWRTPAGETKELALEPDDVRTLHQPHSAREAYVEVDLDLDQRECAQLEIVYSCPEHTLSEDARAIVAKARANLKARGK